MVFLCHADWSVTEGPYVKYRLKWPRTPRTAGGFATVLRGGNERCLNIQFLKQNVCEGMRSTALERETVMCIMWAQYGGGGSRNSIPWTVLNDWQILSVSDKSTETCSYNNPRLWSIKCAPWTAYTPDKHICRPLKLFLGVPCCTESNDPLTKGT